MFVGGYDIVRVNSSPNKKGVLGRRASTTLKGTSILILFCPSPRTTGRLTTPKRYVVCTADLVREKATLFMSFFFFFVFPNLLNDSRNMTDVELALSTSVLFKLTHSTSTFTTRASSWRLLRESFIHQKKEMMTAEHLLGSWFISQLYDRRY